MKISVIQTQRSFAYDPADPGGYDLSRCRELSRQEMARGFAMVEQAAREGAGLIVTIEGFNESISPRDTRYDLRQAAEPLDGPVLARFRDIARAHRTHVVAGLYLRRGDRLTNSAVLMDPGGSIVGIYDKVHLALGEDRTFVPGDFYPVFDTAIGRVGMLICWDMQFPEAVREVALAGADLIACPTLGWERIYGPCRAYENGIPIAVAMYIPCGRELWDGCDPSCIVDGLGRYLAVGGRSGSQIVTAELELPHEPPAQYGFAEATGMQSMRQVRMLRRRPDTYGLATVARPPVLDRYAGGSRP